MNIEEVHFCLEVLVGRTCKEVKATVKTEDCISLLNNGTNGSEADYIVIALAACKVAESLNGVGCFCGVYIVKLDAKLLCMLYCIDAFSSCQTSIVNIGNDKARGLN